MMKHLLIYILLISSWCTLNSQTIYEDFEGGSAKVSWATFNGMVYEGPIANPDKNGNSSDFVGKFVNDGVADFCFGLGTLSAPADLSVNNMMKIKIWTVFKYFLKYESERNGKKISCDQTPRNALFIEEILKMYPHTFIIAMIRGPRDVLLSQKGKWKRRFLGAKTIPLKESLRSSLNYHPITITKLWSASTRTILKYNNHERVRIVRFEDLIENPEKTVQQMCAFTGLTYSADMLKVPKVGSSNAGDSPAKIGISSDNNGNFMKGLSHSEIYLCEKNTEQLRQQAGEDA